MSAVVLIMNHFKMRKLNFVSSMVKFSLTSLGMFRNGKKRIAYSIIFSILCSGGFLGTTVGFLNTTGAGYKLESLASLLANFNSVVLFAVVNFSHAKISQLFVKRKGYIEEDIDDLIDRTDKYIKKELIWYFIALMAQGSLFTVITMISSLFEDHINNMFSIVVPFWFSCSNKGLDRKAPCIHWETFSKIQLLAANLVQVFFLMLQFAVYICSFALYGISIGELVVHFENIKIKVKFFNMQNEGGLVFQNRRPSNFNPRLIQREKRSVEELLGIVKYQQFLHRCILHTIDAWKPYLTCIYVTSFVDMTMVVFTIFMEHENSRIFFMKAASLVTFRFLLLLIVSSYAQTLVTLMDEMLEETSHMRWYDQGLKFRKIYILVLILNQRTIVMLAGGIVRINLNSFLQLLKTMYSILNLLILKYGR